MCQCVVAACLCVSVCCSSVSVCVSVFELIRIKETLLAQRDEKQRENEELLHKLDELQTNNVSFDEKFSVMANHVQAVSLY